MYLKREAKSFPGNKRKNVKEAGFEPPRFGTFQNGNFHRTENVGFFGGKPDLSGEKPKFSKKKPHFSGKGRTFCGEKAGFVGEKNYIRVSRATFLSSLSGFPAAVWDGAGRDGAGLAEGAQ